MNILVLYNSRSGNTRSTAEAIAQIARELDATVSVKSVIEVQGRNIENADVIFIGTWVHGLILFGVRPAGAELWVPSLPSLEGKLVATFCTYAFNPRGSLNQLGSMLEARGATIAGQHVFHRSRLDDGAEAFVRDVLGSAEKMPV